MTRTEFSRSVRMAAWTRCNGLCERCGAKLFPGKFAFDHIKPDGLGGTATLDNCRVLCDACHGHKTATEDIPRMAKADRQKAKHLGIFPRSRARIPSRKFASTREHHD